MECRICLNKKDNTSYEFQEMMFGYRDKFSYFQCSSCGCLQISDIPLDMRKYYPPDYYSFSQTKKNDNPIKYFIKRLRNNYALFNKGLVGKLLYRRFPIDFAFNKYMHLTKDTRILDVGCGVGNLLYELSISTLKNMLGIDPYIDKEIIYSKKLKIVRKDIKELEGEWDLVMFNHSFEHIQDPVETIEIVSRLLAGGGVCLIRIPTVSSFAWEHYKENWVQIDAPRHFFLHSIDSIKKLCWKVHLDMEKVVYDSTSFQYWGSEQYIRGIPLKSEQSHWVNPSESIFSEADIIKFEQSAQKLNLENRGDQAAFYLKKRYK